MDILERFRAAPATCVADALGGMNNLDQAIRPLREEYALCGRALTVSMPVGDNTAVLRAIATGGPGDVLVIAAHGHTARAVAGDFVIGLAQRMGLNGVVVDGAIRDIRSIKDSGFPVFCRSATCSASLKNGAGEINIPVSCGGVSIMPGDIIVGDADGVIAVPAAKAEEVLAAALHKLRKDEERAAAYLKDRESAHNYLKNLFKGQ